MADARAALAQHSRMLRGAPGTGAVFEPLQRKLNGWKRDADRLTPQVQQALAASRRENVLCNQLVIVEEGFKLASAMLNLASTFGKVLTAFAVDLDLSVASNHAPKQCQEGCKLAFSQAVKLREWYKPAAKQAAKRSFNFSEFASNLPGLALDLSAFATHALFDAYCERFEGPATGTMRAEFTSGGRPWWKYTFNVEGTLSLFYRKGAASRKGMAVSGHLVGTGTRFALWENALPVIGGNLMNGAVTIGGTTPPIGIPFSNFEGLAALQVAPTAFFIPVEGELVGTKLTLRFGPARSDFNQTYTTATGRYVIISPIMMGYPVYTQFQLPFKNARFLVERATGGGPVTLDVKIGGKTMKAERTFHAQRGGGEAQGTYDLGVTLCNPGCDDTSNSPAQSAQQ